MRLYLRFHPLLGAFAVSCLLASVILSSTQARQSPRKPAEKRGAKASTPAEPENPAQIELLETRYRFEANGDSRKDVHTRVKINGELGVRQFARLNFDYNRAFESIDLPLIRITHPSGGTVDILPSAITDNPNPAVANAPAYQDVRVKSVRILGLAPGDLLEYRVITTVSRQPLAPDFWLDHSFDRTGVVTEEHFEIDVPASRKVQLHVQPEFTYEIIESENRTEARVSYRWTRTALPNSGAASGAAQAEPDVVLTSFKSWLELSLSLGKLLLPPGHPPTEVAKRAAALTLDKVTAGEKLQNIYDFTSQKISSIDLPLGSTGFHVRPADEILSSGYATAEEKLVLFAGLCQSLDFGATGVFAGAPEHTETQIPRPSPFTHLLIVTVDSKHVVMLDPALEVAPFGMIPSNLRDKRVLYLNRPLSPSVGDVSFNTWVPSSQEVPYPSVQRVNVRATLATDGKLTAKVHYAMRGDNELLLRVAFHQAPKEKWKDLAQLLSISDGFRGKVTSVTASDPSATREPFTLDYEITMPKFLDWSKQPVHIPALLPQIGLPDPPANPVTGAASSPIELGTPLEVETHMTLQLPPGTTAQTPTGTSVQRDYATFASEYSAKGPTITASRHINFLLRQVPAERAADYNAFLRAVRNDEAQDFTLDQPATAPRNPLSAKPPKPHLPPKQAKP